MIVFEGVDENEGDPLGENDKESSSSAGKSWRLQVPTYYVDWERPAPFALASPGFYRNAHAPRNKDMFPDPIPWCTVDKDDIKSWDSVEITLVNNNLLIDSMQEWREVK